jgi:hypothetical protein
LIKTAMLIAVAGSGICVLGPVLQTSGGGSRRCDAGHAQTQGSIGASYDREEGGKAVVDNF